ncbi:MAG: WD40 repeat protein [Verrucomicrobiales bacterium]|jgi:WD40 repeat protein
MSRFTKFFALLLAVSPLAAVAQDAPLEVAKLNRDSPVDFNAEIVPIMKKNCFACHNQTKAKAKLVLETPEAILKGGDTGPAIVPGNAADSLLFTTAAHIEEPIMPPAKNKSNAVNLNPQELALLKLWIDQGAKGTANIAPAAPEQWLRSEHEPIYTVAISPDGRYAACGRGHNVHVYDLVKQKLVAELVDPDLEGVTHRDFVHSLAFSPDGTLATGGYRVAKLWRKPEVLPISETAALEVHSAIAVSADGKWRALGLTDGTIKIFNLAEPAAAAVSVKDHTAQINGLAFLPDNQTLISGSMDKTLRRRSLADATKSDKIDVPAEVHSLALIENGARAAFATQDNFVRIVAVTAFNPPPAAAPAPAAAAPAPAAPAAAPAAPEPPKIEFVELAGSTKPQTILETVKIADVEHLVSAGEDAIVRIWNIEGKALLRQIAIGGPVLALDLSSDGEKVIVQRAAAGPARMFKLVDGALIKDLELNPQISLQVAEIQRQEQMATRLANLYKAEVPKLEASWTKEGEAADNAGKEIPKAKEAFGVKQAELAVKRRAKQLADYTLTTKSVDPVLSAEDAQTNIDAAKVVVTEATTAITAAATAHAANVKALTSTKTAADTASTATATALAAAKKAEAANTAAKAAPVKAVADAQAKVAAAKTAADAAATKAAETALAAATKLVAANDAKQVTLVKTSADATAKDVAAKKTAADSLAALTAANTANTANVAKLNETKAAADKASAAAAVALVAAKAVEVAKTELETADAEFANAKRGVGLAVRNRDLASKLTGDAARKLADGKAKQITWETAIEALKVQREALLKTLAEEVPKLEIAGVAFTQDGTQAMTSLKDGSINIYNATDGLYLKSIQTNQKVVGLDLDADGHLITKLEDRRLITWMTNSSWALAEKLGNGVDPETLIDRVTAMEFSPDGSTLVTGSGVASRSGRLKIWNPITLELIAENVEAHSDTISDIKFSPTGDKIVTGSTDKFVKSFDAATAEHLRSFEAHTGHVLGVSWSHDGRRLASSSADTEVKLWDADSGEQIKTIKGWTKEVTSVAFFSPANEQVLTSSGDSNLKLDTGAIAGATSFQYSAAVSRDGKYFVAGGEDGVLRVWNAARQLVVSFESPNAKAEAEAVAAAGAE